MLIYKIFRTLEWAEFRKLGQTRGAPIDLVDGYIHFSTGAQLGETCQKHFAGAKGLILVALESEDLAHDLKWERSRAARFSHIFTGICGCRMRCGTAICRLAPTATCFPRAFYEDV